MARRVIDPDGFVWFSRVGSRKIVRALAARNGHDVDRWYALADAGPYKREAGICRHCGMVGAYGLVYRGANRTPVPGMWGPAVTGRCRGQPHWHSPR